MQAWNHDTNWKDGGYRSSGIRAKGKSRDMGMPNFRALGYTFKERGEKMTTYVYEIIEYHMQSFPKIRDLNNLRYIDLLDYVTDVQKWEKNIRDLIEFDKEHAKDIPNPFFDVIYKSTDAGHRGG
jgi:hypothetical protein